MLVENFVPYELSEFRIQTLCIDSPSLKRNPLKDSSRRWIPILVPKTGGGSSTAPLRVVFVLAGFAGNGPKSLGPKVFEENMAQSLDRCVQEKQAPRALYVFVDAMTFWGGSQFINSKGTGNYEDYLIKDLVPLVKENFDCCSKPESWCITGGSSGGYGALHLASKYPGVFATVAAIAPDSFFEQSLLPEIYSARPLIEAVGGVGAVEKEMREGVFLRRRQSFDMLNVIAMGRCYAPKVGGGIAWPIDIKTGHLDKILWKIWKAHDPIVFLKKRSAKLKELKNVYLSVGNRDEYQLQYGAHQIKKVFSEAQCPIKFYEFSGTHRDISKERPHLWKWLRQIWS